MTEPTKLTHVVPPEQDGWRLRSVLLTGMGLSRKLLVRQRGLEGSITVNGSTDVLYRPMRAGDVVEVTLPVEQSETILPQPMEFGIIYEDEHLLIVNKPWGLIVHPTSGHYTGTLANGIVHYWQERGESYRFRPIHRLDQDTSGVLAVAKNGYAHQFVSEQFQAGQVRKSYIAVVYGRMSADAGTVEGPIDRDIDVPHMRVVTPTGAASTTHYEVVERFADATVVRVKPVTGRTHQIRVHMKFIGHPLMGDELYIDAERHPPRELPIARQALHAETLSFVHPESKERVTFAAPLTPDLETLITFLREEGEPTS
ncbi:RluA family pseudouridine synthase [Paenibacillus antri]|uniref:Pseudouridine synthase n=1 Tax=Paenibacillus antri TaxID=2582848 RepID=A0A5R9GIT2_9BACL|nr:RluA family pseudouridine synthase [Paenibacillus antri]TLS51475.1 RluA family pseudouridine synthase [Paenibacillus antri]